jgi:hypothetical protein
MNPNRAFGMNLLMLAAFYLAAAAAGCKSGPATGEVHGNVTFKGKPVKASGAEITFYNSKTGDTAAANLDENGGYVVEARLPVGEYIVFISPGTHLVDTDPGKTPPSKEEKPAPDIPRRYRSQASTTLKTTITEGKNKADFDMVP